MAAIELDDLTTMNLDGSGVFDTLMAAVALNLKKEYSSGRIKGSDYSKVYLGSITAVMQQSMAFLMGKQVADKQAELLSAQTATEVINATLATQQELILVEELLVAENKALISDNEKTISDDAVTLSASEVTKIANQEAIKTQELLKISAEVALINEQSAKVGNESTLLTTQEEIATQEVLLAEDKVTMSGDQKLISAGAATMVSDEKLIKKQELLKIGAEVDLIGVQNSKIVQDEAVALAQIDVIEAQDDKVVAEKDLLDQKLLTEKAQILDTVEGVLVTGVIGKQAALYAQQTKGFIRDAEQKIIKLLSDGWSVDKSVIGAGISTPDVFNKTLIDFAVKDAITNAGLPIAATP